MTRMWNSENKKKYMKTAVFMVWTLLFFSQWTEYEEIKKTYCKRNATAEFSLSLTLYLGYFPSRQTCSKFTVLAHFAPWSNVEVKTWTLIITQNWTLIIIVISEQTRSILRVWSYCHPMQTFSRLYLLFGLYLPLEAKFPNIKSLIKFAVSQQDRPK